MFVSADFLAINYGVHDEIAHFFTERDPPPIIFIGRIN